MRNLHGASIAEATAAVRKPCAALLSAYEQRYEELRKSHPVYGRGGWHAAVTAPHRFMNFIAVAEFAQECDWNWIDVGAYDGALVAMLRAHRVTAYGIEPVAWPEMWKLLSIEDYMNVAVAPHVHTISALNYAHAFPPVEFVERLFDQYGEPELLLVDREMRTPHPNNKLWYDTALLEMLGFQEVLSFPKEAQTDINYGRELLVRRRV